jgi:hypothetical protein
MEELREDKEKLEKIMGLIEEVKKYFAYNTWSYFKVGVDKEAISLMRSIYKRTGYDVIYRKKKINGELKTEYNINKNV